MLRWLIVLLTATSALCCDLEPVRDLRVFATTSSQIRVRWSPPTAAALRCAQGYRVCATATAPGATPRCASLRSAHLGGHVVADLPPCEQLNVSVAVLGAAGSMSAPASVMATTAPGPAAGLAVSREGGARIVARWTYDVTAAGACAEMFNLSWCAGREACGVARVPVSARSSYSQQLWFAQYCSSLRRCWHPCRYSVSLAALDGELRSSGALVASLDELLIGGPENLTVRNCSSSSIEVGWAVPERQASCEYRVLVEVSFSEDPTLRTARTSHPAGTRSLVLGGLAPCREHLVTVELGTTSRSRNKSTQAYTLPRGQEVLSNASVVHVTSSSVGVAWCVTLAERGCIRGVSVCWVSSVSSLSSLSSDCLLAAGDSLELTGLQPRTSYQLTLRALFATGLTLQSLTLEATTAAASGQNFFFCNANIILFMNLLLFLCIFKTGML
ncbi:uncharacterized protein LOC134537333 isoform X2 [Bacillus rossius redtenbacheri]|uniref:uncharacterized protein LOC134537333 isoform X2 n=1 Tax=Bacillus rossius redtenbacheri TaxID=93214 RepID=UPI002FDE5AF0